MNRILLILVFCTIVKAMGQNTRTVSFGLNKRVASFSIVGQVERNFDGAYTTALNKDYVFDKTGRLQVETDLILTSKQIYQYDKKGNCVKIVSYENDTLHSITTLNRQKDKIFYTFERNKQIESTGYYVVDKYDRVIEIASIDKSNNTVIYTETYKYDNNSLVISSIHSFEGRTMITEFENVITERDSYQNWIAYNSTSTNIIFGKSNYRRTIRYNN